MNETLSSHVVLLKRGEVAVYCHDVSALQHYNHGDHSLCNAIGYLHDDITYTRFDWSTSLINY